VAGVRAWFSFARPRQVVRSASWACTLGGTACQAMVSIRWCCALRWYRHSRSCQAAPMMAMRVRGMTMELLIKGGSVYLCVVRGIYAIWLMCESRRQMLRMLHQTAARARTHYSAKVDCFLECAGGAVLFVVSIAFLVAYAHGALSNRAGAEEDCRIRLSAHLPVSCQRGQRRTCRERRHALRKDRALPSSNGHSYIRPIASSAACLRIMNPMTLRPPPLISTGVASLRCPNQSLL